VEYSAENPFATEDGGEGPGGKTYAPDNPFAKRAGVTPSPYSPDNPFAGKGGGVAAPPAPVRMPPVVVTAERPTSDPRTGDVDLRGPAAAAPRAQIAPPAIAPRDAVRPDRRRGVQLTGAAKFGTDVFSGLASAFEHPVETTVGMAVAPIESAAKAGLFLGQRANDAIDPNANDVGAAMGVPRISDEEAKNAALQLGAVALGGRLRLGAARGTVAALERAGASDVVARGAGGAVGGATEGAAIGAAYDPEHRGRGAVLGGAAGLLLNEAAAADRPAPPGRAPETSPDRMLPRRSPVAPRATMRKVARRSSISRPSTRRRSSSSRRGRIIREHAAASRSSWSTRARR
jgi:hypothetical protein